jgi:hypothetical protein
MDEVPLHMLIQESIQIAWDYFGRTGEFEERENGRQVFTGSVELMIRQGVRSRLIRGSNGAVGWLKRTGSFQASPVSS